MSGWHLKTWILISNALWVVGSVQPLTAQVTPDSTLPLGERSQVSGNPNFQINGGARRGGNLFHSFQQFSVPTGGEAFFNNAADVQNILTRVTGGTISNIDGVIRANGTANLFLLNPSGIIFGANASLNIGGSFVASTADAIGFSNLGFFSASTPEAPSPLLTINPSALFFNQIAAAPIQNNSTAPAGTTLAGDDAFGLRVQDGKSLLLVGGNISMDGGGLNALGGRVELGGLASGGTVGLNVDGNNLSLSFPNSVERSDVFLSNGAQVIVLAGNGGSITVNARNVEMTGASFLLAGIDSGQGSSNSKAGNISVNATGVINLDNGSRIGNQVQPQAKGQGGDVNISASTLQVSAGGKIYAATFGVGKAGNLSVDAQDVQIIGTTADGKSLSALAASAEANSTGDAGNLTIKTNTLLVRDGAQIGAGTRGAGKGGNLTVDAQDVQLIGTSADGRVPSGLFASAVISLSTGDAGDLTIKTNTLLVRDGAQVLTATFGPGKGGNLNVDAQDVQIIGSSASGLPSALVAGIQNSPKDAGDLTIKTNTLLLRDGALVTVENQGTGTAGNLTINARSIRLDNNGTLSANTRSPKVDPNREQATININSQDLILTGNSNIITNATGANVFGGNININTDALVGIQNSDITANSANFRGGNVRINAQGIIGIQVRDVASPQTSDITATGATRELSGNVQLTRPDVDPASGLVELPANLTDNSGLITQGCAANQGNSFVVTGRGGLPPNPEQQLDDNADWQDRRRITVVQQTNNGSNGSRQQSNGRISTPHPPLIEATGWQISPTGDVILVAATSKTVQNPLLQPVVCQVRR
jgi:filamentous hemagglutinin family protein